MKYNKNIFRSIAERLSRGIVIKRKLPAAFGRRYIFVSPDAQLKYIKPGAGGFDTGLLKIVQEQIRSGMRVWDIGANIGIFSIAAAAISPNVSVIAVEPDVWLSRIIQKTLLLRQNRDLHVRVISAAVCSRCGVTTLCIAKRGRASNALEEAAGRSQMGGIRSKELVPTITLDTLLECSGTPDFVKIDIEGAESLALQGAQNMLKNARPVIYIEVGAETCEDVTDILRRNNYRLFDGASEKHNRMEIETCCHNTLAVPSEKI